MHSSQNAATACTAWLATNVTQPHDARLSKSLRCGSARYGRERLRRVPPDARDTPTPLFRLQLAQEEGEEHGRRHRLNTNRLPSLAADRHYVLFSYCVCGSERDDSGARVAQVVR